MKPIMTLKETENEYIASVNEISIIVPKNTIEIKNGIKQHPRIMAIEKASEIAKISEWTLFNC